MRIEKISESQAYILITIFIIGTSLALTGYSIALQDTWISIILALIYATPLVMIYGNIVKKFPDMDLFQIIEFIFGKLLGKVINICYTFYFLHLGALCIRNVTEYIQVVSFPETPQYFTGLFMIALTIYIIKCGMEVIARVSKFLLPLLIFITVITFIMTIPKAETNNFLPILYNGWGPVFKASFSPLAFPFGETVIFLVLLCNVEGTKKSSKIFLIGIYVGGFLLLNVVIRNILILGFPNLASSNFPSYYAVTLIDIGNFIRGIELVVSVNLLISGFIKISMCLLATCIGICRIFNFGDLSIKETSSSFHTPLQPGEKYMGDQYFLPGYKWVSAPLGMLMLALSFILFESTMHMIEWLEIYKYYAIPFQVIFPLLIFIIGMFKKKKLQSVNDSQPE